MSHFPPTQQHHTAGQDDKDIHNLTFDPSLSDAGTLPALRTPAHQELLAILSHELYGQPRQQQLNGGNRVGNSEDCSGTQDNNIYSYQNNSEINFHHQRNQHRTNDYYCGSNPDGVEEDGLVSPLRRPHINEIPPDLLAFMLKSPKFEEILAHPHLQQQIQSSISNSQTNRGRGSDRDVVPTTINPNTRNTYGDAINVVNVSTSNIRTSPQQSNQTKTQTRNVNATTRSPLQPQPIADNATKLSPMAKEFVPKPYGMQNSDTDDLAMAFAQVQASMQNSFPNSSQSSTTSQNDFESTEDRVLSTVTDTINQLTKHPADFQRCAKHTADTLKRYLTDVDILGIVVTLVVEQSISNANFRYSGARLCQVLHKNEIKTPESTFKNALISRCQEEFQGCLKNVSMKGEPLARTHGFLMFLGELYMNFHIEQGGKTVPITIFGLAAIELMSKLVSACPSHENIKFIFHLLKLLGWELENASDARLKSEMEKFIKDLSYILACKQLPEQTLRLVEDLFTLKRKNWNRNEDVYSGDGGRTNAPTYQNNSYSLSETQYFELPDDVDDNDDDFDGGNILLDDEPDDVGEAYEAFLQELDKGSRR